jgi:hypothetical protein
MHIRRPLIAATSMFLLVSACAGTDDEPVAHVTKAMGDRTSGVGGSGGAPICPVEACFHIEKDKDISFIAVLADACPGEELDIALYYPDMTPVNVTPQPHGQGIPCKRSGIGIDPNALKFDGLDQNRYILCTTLADAVTIITKAGPTCWQQSFDLECSPCSDGGAGGTRGEGGSDAGGSGGRDKPCDY